LKFKCNVEILVRAQRRSLLRVACAYRTVSAEAIQVKVRRQKILHQRVGARGEGEESLLSDSQRRWNGGENGAWTRALIPNISTWIGRKHGELEFHLTQALTGHGCFAAFLHKIGKEQEDRCWYCAERDDAEHTLFVCEAWDEERLALMRKTMH
jgi:hypothetical protein